MTAPFVLLAAVAIAGATAAMTMRKLVHCALALALCFVGLAGLYLDLNAQFVGLVQVLVYVGAVVILIVFAILLTRHDELPLQTVSTRIAGLGLSAVVFAVLAWAITAGGANLGAASAIPEAAMKDIGGALMQRYVLPLEVVGLLLTAALIGAVVIAMEEKKSK
jgi:NADH:ubiquinone oxidoreductase subunit 6 (subunit J)